MTSQAEIPSRYVAAHASPQGPGDARPTAQQIIQDEGLENALTGKVILITGCSSGIGIETARSLSTTGATLYLTARNIDKAKTALGEPAQQSNIHFLELDLGSLSSVRACAAEFLKKSNTLNILIANAGVMIPPYGRTVDGFEIQFGTNHLGHFLLFELLKDILIKSSTPELSSRVIMVASSGHRAAEVRFEDYNFENGYNPWEGYGQSKTAMIWTANEIERRFGGRGVHAWSLHPGAILTELGRHVDEEGQRQWALMEGMKEAVKSVEQGAATTVWAAVGRGLEGRGGRYLEDCQVIGPLSKDAGLLEPGYAPWVYDEEKAGRLYELSLGLVGLT
ncbi:short-chain dehydrogenase protein [Rutstroemia sp. NJR-2017a WRK4]|nr:short-chain dehydrogenase protein [Rutstroemia sp. NJR-2017a WRK4]